MQLVSVIIPVYNRGCNIGNAIQSVIEQTYRYIEIIVVDDGSTDDTATAVSVYSNVIKYFYKTNGGVSSARNYGVDQCTGAFVAFLDSDDTWLPNKIQKQVTYLEQHQDIGMVLCDCIFVEPDGNYIGTSRRRDFLPKDGNILQNVVLHPSLIPSSVLMRKEVLLSVGKFDETIKTAEDLDLHLKIACRYKIGLICEPLFKCMRGNAGLSQLSRTYDDHVFVLERFASLFSNRIDSAILKYALFKTYVEAANGKLWSGDTNNAMQYMLKLSKKISIKTIPTVIIMWLKILKYLWLNIRVTAGRND